MKLTKIVSFAAAFALAFVFAGSASAATISGAGTAIFNSQTNLYGNAGNTYQVSTNFDVPTGQVLHAIETDFIGDFVGPKCQIVDSVEGAQTNVSVSFSETLPPNAANYGYTMRAFTGATLPEADALNATDGTACTGTNTTVYNKPNVVHVLPIGSTSGSTGTTSSIQVQIDTLTAAASSTNASILALTKALTDLIKAQNSTGGTAHVCAELTPFAGLYQGMKSSAVSGLQAFLMANGQAAAFQSAGVYSPTMNFGPITAGALAAYRGQKSCSN